MGSSEQEPLLAVMLPEVVRVLQHASATADSVRKWLLHGQKAERSNFPALEHCNPVFSSGCEMYLKPDESAVCVHAWWVGFIDAKFVANMVVCAYRHAVQPIHSCLLAMACIDSLRCILSAAQH